MSAPERRAPVDRGWAWVILGASFLSLLCISGALYSVSVFNIIFLEVFGESKATTSWVGSMLIGLMALMGPVSSALTERLGWRPVIMVGGLIASCGTLIAAYAQSIRAVFFGFGLMSGIGHGLAYTPSIVVVGYFFDRYRTAASGIASVGAGTGMLAFPILIDYTVKLFTWRGTLVILAGLYLQLVVLGALMRPIDSVHSTALAALASFKPPGAELEQEGSVVVGGGGSVVGGSVGNISNISRSSKDPHRYPRHSHRRRLRLTLDALRRSGHQLRQGKFVIFCASIFTFGLGLSALYLHLSAFAISKGASAEEATLLLTIAGVASVASRVITGIAGNDGSVDNVVLYVGAFGVTGICTLACPIIGQTRYGRALYSALLGFYGSCFNVLLAPLTVELIGLRHLTTAFGMEMVVNGLAYLIGPPLAGLLYDMTHSFDASFYLAGCCLIASSLIMTMVSVFDKSLTKTKSAPGYIYTVAAQEEEDAECIEGDDELEKGHREDLLDAKLAIV